MKNALPYYKRYPRDFIEGTIGLDLETKGAYAIILDLIYMQGGQLPDDEKYICGLLGCSAKKWKTIRQTLLDLDKIHVNGRFISNSRADLELESLKKFSDAQSERASGPRKNKDLEEPTAKPKRSQPEPEPDIIKKEPSVPKKGTRIPDDFQPDFDEAVRLGVPMQMVSKEAAKFRDYWTAKTGKDATKLDWPATWRNWCRNAASRLGARSSPAKSNFRDHQDEVTKSFERAANGRDSTAEQSSFLDLGREDYRRGK